LILRKIKIVAIRCHILKLKCTKYDFGWVFAPGPAGGAPQTTYLDLRGPTSKGMKGEEGKGGEGTG